jgi:hypothetical protein
MDTIHINNKYDISDDDIKLIKRMKVDRDFNKKNCSNHYLHTYNSIKYKKLLYRAVKCNDFKCVLSILSKTVPLDQNIYTASEIKNKENMGCLYDLDNNIYIHTKQNSLNINGCYHTKYYGHHTPLSFACSKGYTKIVYALLELGACPNQTILDKHGCYKSLIYYAIYSNNYNVIKMIYDYNYINIDTFYKEKNLKCIMKKCTIDTFIQIYNEILMLSSINIYELQNNSVDENRTDIFTFLKKNDRIN